LSHAVDDGLMYPSTANGMPGSLDGYLMPEFTTAPTAMKAGDDAFGQPATTIRFEFNDGTPYPQTISVDGVPMTASDWKLIQIGPDAYKWAPLP